jgi:hypothetical protein
MSSSDTKSLSAVVCPFCKEGDFDLIGLKSHFMRGWCEVFNATIRPEEERFDKSDLQRLHSTGRTKAGNDISGI